MSVLANSAHSYYNSRLILQPYHQLAWLDRENKLGATVHQKSAISVGLITTIQEIFTYIWKLWEVLNID